MLLSHRTGHGVPLLAICAAMAGCATSTVPQPPNFNSDPQIVAIFAVDSTFAVLPDVLVFSTDPADSSKTSTSPPPSYGSYRVEFDQPIAGDTIANQPDLTTAIGTAASFCSPLGTSPIQLIDVQGDGSRPAGPVASSVCYDASSPLGSHPHVLLIPGAGALTSASAKPLTCTTFTPEDGTSSPATGGNVFKPNHKYGIKVTSGVAKNAANRPLSAPTLAGSGWVGDTFQFTTSGLKIMAAGYQDAVTGFFVWIDKPEPGFEKDLLATPSAQKPADDSPFLIVLTEPVSDASAVTLRRADGSDPASAVTTAGVLGDLRVIEVNTGDRFESATTYKVTVPATLAADSGDTLGGTGKVYTFTAATAAPAVIGTTPANGAQAQATSVKPVVEFSAPIAVTDAAGTPAASFKLATAAGAAVPLSKVIADPASNFEKVTLTPAAALTPETTYTISWTGVKSGPPVAGQTFPDGSAQFTTATFRISRVSVAPSTANIDRATNVSPLAINNGKLTLVFNSTATGVDATTVSLSELNGSANTPTKLTGYTVTQGASASTYVISMPSTYQPKFGQKYEVRAAASITDSVSGKKLRAEGCTATDCSDAKSFTTRAVNLTLAADPSDDAPTGFRATFSDPMQISTLTPLLPKAFKLFQRDANGALNPNPLAITCTITSAAGANTVVTCKPTAALGKAPSSYLASAVFLQTPTADGGPAIVDPSVSTDPSAKFFGSRTRTIIGPCP